MPGMYPYLDARVKSRTFTKLRLFATEELERRLLSGIASRSWKGAVGLSLSVVVMRVERTPGLGLQVYVLDRERYWETSMEESGTWEERVVEVLGVAAMASSSSPLLPLAEGT